MKENTMLIIAVVVTALAGWLVVSLLMGSPKMQKSPSLDSQRVMSPVGGKVVKVQTLLSIPNNDVSTKLRVQ